MNVDLNRALVLERLVKAGDGAGGFTRSWQAVGTLWAEVVAGSGRDVAGEEFTLSAVPYRITVRGAPVGSPQRPRADQRFREGTRAFRIVAVTERDPAGAFLLCFAREEVPA